ncbi:MAG: hypothetical protein WDN72_09345 [Alphaproteobacteria bacterium]
MARRKPPSTPKRFGRDAVSHAQRTAGNAQQALTDAAELSRENLEALTQSGSIAASAGKELGAEIVSYGQPRLRAERRAGQAGPRLPHPQRHVRPFGPHS